MGRQGRVGVDGGLESFDRELSLCPGYPGELGAAGVEFGAVAFVFVDMRDRRAEDGMGRRAEAGEAAASVVAARAGATWSYAWRAAAGALAALGKNFFCRSFIKPIMIALCLTPRTA